MAAAFQRERRSSVGLDGRAAKEEWGSGQRRQPLRSVDLGSTWTVGREGMVDGGFWILDDEWWISDVGTPMAAAVQRERRSSAGLDGRVRMDGEWWHAAGGSR